MQALATAPAELRWLLADLPPALAAQRPGESWGPAEIVQHLLDVETRYRARLEQVMEQEQPRLEPILPPAAGYCADEPIGELLQQFGDARERTVAFLKPLPVEVWRRMAVHPSGGLNSFFQLVQRLVSHDREHINQVRDLIEKTSGEKERRQ